MGKREPAGPDEISRGLTRRQFLQAVPAIGAFAVTGSALDAARSAVSESESPAGQAMATVPELETSALDMPFRKKKEAVTDCTWRRYWEDRRGTPPGSDLEQLLGNVSLADSRIGLANWPILDETEDLNLGHFSFPMSPFNTTADDGEQQFLLCSNSKMIASFREREYLEQVHRRIFDRAVWAMDSGRIGTAVVEFDRTFTDQKVARIVQLLSYYGIKTIIWGNELNDPNAPWRDNLPGLFEVFTSAAAVKQEYGLKDVDLCLPGIAYYAHGEYLQGMLRTFKDLQRKKFPKAPDNLPFQRVADHFYGPLEQFLPRVQMMKGIISTEGLGQITYDLTEVGNPAVEPGQPPVSDQQLAHGFIPQVAALAMASAAVGRVLYYSLLDSSDEHSLTSIYNGRLVMKSAYRSLVQVAKLLAGFKRIGLTDEKDRARVEGTRSDGKDFMVAWSKVSDQDLWLNVPEKTRVFDALGQAVSPERPNQVALKPKQHPAMGGPARILVGKFL